MSVQSNEKHQRIVTVKFTDIEFMEQVVNCAALKAGVDITDPAVTMRDAADAPGGGTVFEFIVDLNPRPEGEPRQTFKQFVERSAKS